MLLPHHGSWKNGEQFWLEAFLRGVNPAKLLLISSDPSQTNNLPRLSYIQKLSTHHSITSQAISAPHDLSCAAVVQSTKEVLEDGGIQQMEGFAIKQTFTTKQKCKKILCKQVNWNLFLTSCAQASYYNVVIADAGEMRLFDGLELLCPAQVIQPQ